MIPLESIDFIERMWNILVNNWPNYVSGTQNTLLISLTGTVIGLVIGLLIGIVRTIPQPRTTFKAKLLGVVHWLVNAYVSIFRGTPMIVQAMIVYYGSAILWGIDMTPMTAAFIIVSVNTGAYMAEVVRGGIISIDPGQFEAAKAIGMTHWQTMTKIVMPQVFRNILPAVGNEFVINIKDTSVLNVISVNELYFTSASIAGKNYRFFETFLVTAIIYFILTWTVTKLLGLVEKRLAGRGSYELVALPEEETTQ